MSLLKYFTATLAVTAIATTAYATGAVSGGGGGTLPARPVGIYRIEQIVRDSMPELRLYFRNRLQHEDPKYANSGEQKVFFGNETIADVLERTGIEVRTDKPCYDAFQNEVDASIYANHPDDICLSAFRIAPKLIEERARVETLALIVHELSHKLGTDEKEATDLQSMAAIHLNDSLKDIPMDFRFFVRDASDQASHLEGAIESAIGRLKQAPQPNSEVVEHFLFQVMESQRALYKALHFSAAYSFYDHREQSYDDMMEDRLNLALIYLRSIYDKAAQAEWTEKYEEVFGQGKAITYGDYVTQHASYRQDRNEYQTAILYRLDSVEAAINELTELAEYYGKAGQFLFQFSWDHALFTHPAYVKPRTVNPFASFAGRAYKLINTVCTTSNGQGNIRSEPSEIEFTANHMGKPELVLYTRRKIGMTMSDTLEDNGYGNWPAGSVQSLSFEGDINAPTAVESFQEFGRRWGEHWTQNRMRIERRNGKLFWVRTQMSREKSHRGITEYSSRCEAELQ